MLRAQGKAQLLHSYIKEISALNKVETQQEEQNNGGRSTATGY
jgi:hypothetical protein